MLPAAETPSVVCTVVHATDEEKLASSAGNQKWTCMTVDLDSDKQDYPQPSDLSTFVNETKFSSPTEGKLGDGDQVNLYICVRGKNKQVKSDKGPKYAF